MLEDTAQKRPKKNKPPTYIWPNQIQLGVTKLVSMWILDSRNKAF